jgi:hypothetical protein
MVSLLAWLRPMTLKTSAITDTRDGFLLRLPTQQMVKSMIPTLLDGGWDCSIYFQKVNFPSEIGLNVREDAGTLKLQLAMTKEEKNLIAQKVDPNSPAELGTGGENAPAGEPARLTEIKRQSWMQQRDALRVFITEYETRLAQAAQNQALNDQLQQLAQETYRVIRDLYQRTGTRAPRAAPHGHDHYDPDMGDRAGSPNTEQQRKFARLAELVNANHRDFFKEAFATTVPWDRMALAQVVDLPELRALAGTPGVGAPPRPEEPAIQPGILFPRRVALFSHNDPQTAILTIDLTTGSSP